MATKPFVVFEKNHGLFADPVGDDAEDKIVASCKAVKALNASTQCLMYVPNRRCAPNQPPNPNPQKVLTPFWRPNVTWCCTAMRQVRRV